MADNIKKFPTPGQEPTQEPAQEPAPELAPEQTSELNPDTQKPLSADESLPQLDNAKLVAAMAAINKEENQETQRALIEAVLTSRFFAPVDVMDANGEVINAQSKTPIPKDAKFNFRIIQNTKGETYFPVFTDVNEFKRWHEFRKFEEFKKWAATNGTPVETVAAWKSYSALDDEGRKVWRQYAQTQSPEKLNTIVVMFPQIAHLAQLKKDVIKGFVINPVNENIVFTQEAIAGILDTMKKVAEMKKSQEQAQQIRLYPSENIPESVLKTFRKKLERAPEVKEAYFCMMETQGGINYLFVINSDADAEKAKAFGESLCNSAKMFLTKYPVVAAPFNSPFGNTVQKFSKPFYVKK